MESTALISETRSSLETVDVARISLPFVAVETQNHHSLTFSTVGLHIDYSRFARVCKTNQREILDCKSIATPKSAFAISRTATLFDRPHEKNNGHYFVLSSDEISTEDCLQSHGPMSDLRYAVFPTISSSCFCSILT